MKTSVLLSLVISSILSNANASQVEPSCFLKAETAVERQAGVDYYDKNGIQTESCDFAPNRKAVLCEVSAFKGDGAASDTYRVVLNASCSKVFRLELTGEE